MPVSSWTFEFGTSYISNVPECRFTKMKSSWLMETCAMISFTVFSYRLDCSGYGFPPSLTYLLCLPPILPTFLSAFPYQFLSLFFLFDSMLGIKHRDFAHAWQVIYLFWCTVLLRWSSWPWTNVLFSPGSFWFCDPLTQSPKYLGL